MMRIIVNPKAGHGGGRSYLQRLKEQLRDKGTECQIIVTEWPGHTQTLASQAANDGIEKLVVLGGDGTVSEAVNGIAGSSTALGIIAAGTGNDLARSLRLPINKPSEALDVVLSGRKLPIDVGIEGQRRFVSSLGVGFAAEVAEQANRIKGARGSLAFLLAVSRALRRLKPARMIVGLDRGRVLQVMGTCILVQNTPYAGGGLKLAPKAQMNDGYLEVVVISDIGSLDLVMNLPRVYWGRHTGHPKFAVYRTKQVSVEVEEAQKTALDGDPWGKTPIKVKVEPRAVRVLVEK